MNNQNSSDSKEKCPGQIFYENFCNPKILRENLQKAMEKSWKAGVPVIQKDDKGIYELYADGTKKYVE